MPPLSTRPPKDPLRNFLFRVEIAGVTQAGFSEVAIAEHLTDAIDYRTGDQAAHLQKIPGLTKYGDVTLKWGLTDAKDLVLWREAVVAGAPAETVRKDIFIVAIDGHGDEKARLHVHNAWPSKLDHADYNAKGNDVAIVSMTLTHEGVELV